jgi:hypothetical protein
MLQFNIKVPSYNSNLYALVTSSQDLLHWNLFSSCEGKAQIEDVWKQSWGKNLQEKKEKNAVENYIMRSFLIHILHIILLKSWTEGT